MNWEEKVCEEPKKVIIKTQIAIRQDSLQTLLFFFLSLSAALSVSLCFFEKDTNIIIYSRSWKKVFSLHLCFPSAEHFFVWCEQLRQQQKCLKLLYKIVELSTGWFWTTAQWHMSSSIRTILSFNRGYGPMEQSDRMITKEILFRSFSKLSIRCPQYFRRKSQ